jgi:conjugal transfer pilus assembly protein TrbC
MRLKFNRLKHLILAMSICLTGLGVVSPLSASAIAVSKTMPQIEAGTYILVSFSMNDTSLRSYFAEAQRYGAKLIINGFVGKKGEGNKPSKTTAKMRETKINVDINPMLFEAMNVKHVPVIAVIKEDGSIKKVAGHISLASALEIMEEKQAKK